MSKIFTHDAIHKRLPIVVVAAAAAAASVWLLASTYAAAFPGDVNSDGKVDVVDLSILLSNYGRSATAAQGDLNASGAVDITDLSILLSNFGRVSTPSPTPSPSPTSYWRADFENGTANVGTPEQTASENFFVQRMINLSTGVIKRPQNGFPTPEYARAGLRSMKSLLKAPEERDDSQPNTRRLHVIQNTDAGRVLYGQERYLGLSVLFPSSYQLPPASSGNEWHLFYELKHSVDEWSPPISLIAYPNNGGEIGFRFDPFRGDPASNTATASQGYSILRRIPLQRGKWLDVVIRTKASMYNSGPNAGFVEYWYRWVDNTVAAKANPPAYTRLTFQSEGIAFSGQTAYGGTVIGGTGFLRHIIGSYSPHVAANSIVYPEFVHYTDTVRTGPTFESVTP